MPSSYDAVPYTSLAYPRTHPDHLYAIAQVFGVHAPDVDTCRVLEIGCGSGGNLLPMAATMPRASFVGVDLSAGEIARGRTIAQAVVLTNIELRATEAIDGTYDYVIAHGVLSWVTPAIRRHLLARIASVLAPSGVAYVSYNVLPGFALRSAVRDMLRYHAGDGPPVERIASARALLSFLSVRVPRDTGAYRTLIDDEQERLAAADDGYLFHEHLEEENHPLWFHELAAEARAVGLQWLAESDPAATVRARAAPRTHAAIAAVAGDDPIRIEQYFDFMRGRSFRSSLLVRDSHTRVEQDGAELADLYAVSSGADVAIDDPALQTALDRLAMKFPDGERVSDLGSPMFGPLHAASVVELRARPLSLGGSWTSPLARYQALQRGPVTNLRHEPIPLAEAERQLLSLLDGRELSDAAALLGKRFPFDATLATLGRLAFLRSRAP